MSASLPKLVLRRAARLRTVDARSAFLPLNQTTQQTRPTPCSRLKVAFINRVRNASTVVCGPVNLLLDCVARRMIAKIAVFDAGGGLGAYFVGLLAAIKTNGLLLINASFGSEVVSNVWETVLCANIDWTAARATPLYTVGSGCLLNTKGTLATAVVFHNLRLPAARMLWRSNIPAALLHRRNRSFMAGRRLLIPVTRNRTTDGDHIRRRPCVTVLSHRIRPRRRLPFVNIRCGNTSLLQLLFLFGHLLRHILCITVLFDGFGSRFGFGLRLGPASGLGTWGQADGLHDRRA
mmetsp:Transcript_28068/g.72590  ORF Transcript_28068/g.72590 Transcript_28068/m.72590 type:complete len:292 (+) Transcript_28068:1149-2024(+)